jgi:hypothetical protein
MEPNQLSGSNGHTCFPVPDLAAPSRGAQAPKLVTVGLSPTAVTHQIELGRSTVYRESVTAMFQVRYLTTDAMPSISLAARPYRCCRRYPPILHDAIAEDE